MPLCAVKRTIIHVAIFFRIRITKPLQACTGLDQPRDRWLMAVFALLYLIVGIATLRFYGLTWDEGLGNVFFGERYFYI
jgi:hypothetical protein